MSSYNAEEVHIKGEFSPKQNINACACNTNTL